MTIKNKHSLTKGRLQWHSQLQTVIPYLDPTLQPSALDWVKKTGSMTQHIEKATGHKLTVQLKKKDNQQPHPDEIQQLSTSSQDQWLIREVYLLSDQRYCMYARSLFSADTFGEKTSASSYNLDLDDTPLGEYLFKDPNLTRTDFLYTIISATHYEYQQALNTVFFKQPIPPTNLVARRSIFYYFKKPVLLTEVFLPDLLKLSDTDTPTK